MSGALTRYRWWWWQRVTSFQWDGQRDDKPVADLRSRSCGISNDGRHRPSSCPVHHHTKFPAAAAVVANHKFFFFFHIGTRKCRSQSNMTLYSTYIFFRSLFHRKIIFLLRLVCAADWTCVTRLFGFFFFPSSSPLRLSPSSSSPFFHPFQFALQHISPSDVVCVCVCARSHSGLCSALLLIRKWRKE